MQRRARERRAFLSASIAPGRKLWLQENYENLGFRSVSHALDAAIQLLMDSRAPKRKGKSSR